MKRIYTMITVLLLVMPLVAQTTGSRDIRLDDDTDDIHTIFPRNGGHGGYAGISFGYTEIGGQEAIIMGARGSWIIGHSFGIGMGGYGFLNDPVFDPADNLFYNLTGGYGGLVLEPIIAGRWPVHLSLPVTLGAGAVARTAYTEDLFSSMEPEEAFLVESSLFVVAEPGAELEFNLTRWLRLSAYGSYRFTSNINMLDVPQDALRNWNVGMCIKVGAF